MITGVLGRLVNVSITSRFILWRPVFPDYLSVFYDYVLSQELPVKELTEYKGVRIIEDSYVSIKSRHYLYYAESFSGDTSESTV